MENWHFLHKDSSMFAYCELARGALASNELLWPSRPKHHVSWKHLVISTCCVSEYDLWVFIKPLVFDIDSDDGHVSQFWAHVRGGKSFYMQRHVNDACFKNCECPFVFFLFSWAIFSANHVGFMTSPWKQQWGENCRFYHAFQCEDFVGRLTDIAACCHKSKLEEALLKRFYMGLFNHHQCLANEDGISSDWSMLVSQGEKVTLPV